MKGFGSTFLLAAFLLFSVSTASGAPVCVSDTLGGFIGLGSTGCDFGGVLFSDFASLEIPSSATQIDPGAVTVNPVNTPNGPGLEFVVDQTADAGESFDVRVGYLVSGNTFGGITLSMTGASAIGDGAVTTIEDIWPGAFYDPYASGASVLILFAIDGDEDTYEQLSFAPVTNIGLIKDIGVDGGLQGAGGLYSATNQFTVETPVAIPESATILFLATGLGSLGIRRGGSCAP